jgi:hypothetical protein
MASPDVTAAPTEQAVAIRADVPTLTPPVPNGHHPLQAGDVRVDAGNPVPFRYRHEVRHKQK